MRPWARGLSATFTAVRYAATGRNFSRVSVISNPRGGESSVVTTNSPAASLDAKPVRSGFAAMGVRVTTCAGRDSECRYWREGLTPLIESRT